MHEILLAVATAITTIISAFMYVKYDRSQKQLNVFKQEHDFVIQQKEELYASIELITELKQERVGLIEKLSQLEVMLRKAEQEIEKLKAR